MELNIQAIADEKIKAMHESGQIKLQIENDVEKLILKAVDDALDGYKIRREVEENITASVSATLKSIDFTTYNGFISQKIKEITEGVLRQDVSDKIQKVFSEMLIVRHDGIKLSEIFEAYRKWVSEATDDSDKWEYRNFVCDIEEKEDSSFTWYTIKFNDKELNTYDKPQIEIRFLVYQKDRMQVVESDISSLLFDGSYLDKSFKIGPFNEVETLLANLYFNKTKIILDVDDIDDSNHYDIDD